VKGKKNYALYDLLRGKMYGIIPEGNPEELKKQMLQAGLIFETNGVVPVKFEKSIDHYNKSIQLRELQVRITGQCHFDCYDCGKICHCSKSDEEMSEGILEHLLDQFKYIPIHKIRVSGGNPALRPKILKRIKEELQASTFSVYFRGAIEKENLENLEQMGYVVETSSYLESENKKRPIYADSFVFFYTKKYNPCWGHKLAVDTDGSIKICLWQTKTFGSIKEMNIKKMILTGIFNEYWELTKDRIEGCRDCEYRYGCFDCREISFRQNKDLYAANPYCKYNPYDGIWEGEEVD